jgi:flagellar motor protein MotB
MISQNLVRMTQTKTEIRIQLDEMVLFRPGSAVLNPVSLGLISDIATAVQGYPVQMIVEGHADADGTSEEKNWMMSATRAVAVVSEFRRRTDEQGKPLLDGQFLEARGLGQFRPADVEKGQSKWNRRVELVIRGRNTSAVGAIQELDQVLGEQNGRR